MTKKSGLGKGLDALFGPVPEEEKQQGTDKFKNLKLTEIEPNKEQARKVFDQEALEDWLNLSVNMVLFSLLLCALCQTALLTR